jgi:hypothetical protein
MPSYAASPIPELAFASIAFDLDEREETSDGPMLIQSLLQMCFHLAIRESSLILTVRSKRNL